MYVIKVKYNESKSGYFSGGDLDFYLNTESNLENENVEKFETLSDAENRIKYILGKMHASMSVGDWLTKVPVSFEIYEYNFVNSFV